MKKSFYTLCLTILTILDAKAENLYLAGGCFGVQKNF